jgi:hypothetical protein
MQGPLHHPPCTDTHSHNLGRSCDVLQGSVKDRAAVWMVKEAEEQGILVPGGESRTIQPASVQMNAIHCVATCDHADRAAVV